MKQTDNVKFGKDVVQLELSYNSGNVKWYKYFLKVWQFLIRLNTYLPYNPAIQFLGIYPREMKINLPKKTST